ncbi:MAG TPA: hypothetical protein VJ552_03450 [Sediminibacterium sp.]|nr:hypothetical protein [Sediminibacterium sp.]
MKAHKGMRPHDIAVLLKIVALGQNDWMNKDLARDLYISPSEITESLSRSQFAGLINASRKKVFISVLEDFLVFGLKVVFPVQPGSIVKGLPTAHAAPVLKKYVSSEEIYVWPDADGKERGMKIEPLYPGAIEAAKLDLVFYDLLAICDVFRIGKVREIEKAKEQFEKIAESKDDAAAH